MSQPLLSIGMIVKNEERCLERCLKALEPLRQAIPCELVIADTGSTDKTKEIAEKYADILFDFEWVNDFSKARNTVIEKSNGEWFLSVDADEYLISSIDEIISFLTDKSSKKFHLASTIIRNYGNSSMTGIYTDFNAVRLVRKNTNIRYSGTIHESFDITDFNLVKIFTNTIFDHDGYANISPKHLKEKTKRNLKLLEEELNKEPDNIRRILQCLESCGYDIQKKRYYAEYAIKKLKNAPKNNEYIEGFGPPCAKEVVKILLKDKNPIAKEFISWTLERFSNSYHILIDVNHLCAKETFSNEEYEECIRYCKAYLSALKKYHMPDSVSNRDIFIGSPDFVHKHYKYEIQAILTNVLVNLERIDEALQILQQLDLSEIDKTSTIKFFSAIYNIGYTEMAAEVVNNIVEDLLEKHHSKQLETLDQYDLVIDRITKSFSCEEITDGDYNIFKLVSGTIGLSVKISNAQTREEVEKYLKMIEVWEEFMPLALYRSIELNATLPKEFYLMNQNRLSYLVNNLTHKAPKINLDYFQKDAVTSNPEKLYETSFLFNLISVLLLDSRFLTYTSNTKNTILTTYIYIADKLLHNLYSEELLLNENFAVCIPVHHLLGWYLIKAKHIKESAPLEYVKTLRNTLKKVPSAKLIIEFLIEDFKNKEEQKRQNKIKSASPELVAMAEQLKTMLRALPENSPELLAIKQSPAYKQLAFLIDN